MKRLLVIAFLLWCAMVTAQTPSGTETPQSGQQSAEVYAYCEISGTYYGSYPDIDFGQEGSWKSRILKNENGQRYRFNSIVQALNFMTRQGWEFVQGYSSGEKNGTTHYLLRTPVSRLTAEQRQAWEAEPATR